MRLRTWHLRRVALVGAIGWFLALPLVDILRYPNRVSIYSSLQVDAAEYDAIARETAATWHFDLPPKIQPGWITLLAVVYRAAGPTLVAGKLLSWGALVGSVVLCGLLARRVSGPAAGWTAAMLCASSPALRAYTGTLQYEVTAGALALCMLVLAVRAADAGDPCQLARRAAAAGLVSAVLVLTREPFAAVVPMVALWMAGQAKRQVGLGAASISALILVAIAAAPALAWSTHRSLREGRLILISDKGTKEFEYGNNPRANGTFNEPLVGVGEPAGLPFVRQFPHRALVLVARKVLYFWGGLRDGWTVPQPANVWLWRATSGTVPLEVIAPIVRGGWLLVAFVAACWLLGREGFARWWVLPSIVMAIMTIHILTISSYRFAVSVLPISYVIASGPVARLLIAFGSWVRAPVVAVSCALLLFVVVALQFQRPRFHLAYAAADLDGVRADNRVDPVSGRLARTADAARGERPIVLLSDEYLPGGDLTLTIRARRASDAPVRGAAVLRASVSELNGRTACVLDVPEGQLPRERFTQIEIPCRLNAAGPATLAIFSLGTADVLIDEVRLTWTGAP